jgi:hypothetical protein
MRDVTASGCVEALISAVDAIREDDYVAVEDADALSFRDAERSSIWTSRFLRRRADPFHVAAVRTSVHYGSERAAADVVRYAYAVDDCNLVVLETWSYLALKVRGAAREVLESDDPRDRLETLVMQVVRTSSTERGHDWTFVYPHRIEQGARFSTAPAQDRSRSRASCSAWMAACRGTTSSFCSTSAVAGRVWRTASANWAGSMIIAEHGSPDRPPRDRPALALAPPRSFVRPAPPPRLPWLRLALERNVHG